MKIREIRGVFILCPILQYAVLNYGIHAGMIPSMGTQRKITVHMPDDLVRRALDSSGKGLTATVRQGLELVAAGKTYQALRKLRGKVRFSTDLGGLREDRR
jgi:hypothetical protein